PVAIDANVADLDRVRTHVANQRRPHQKAIPIEFAAAAIIVVERAVLNRITLLDEVLAEKVRDVNILVSQIEAIQTTGGVFLELLKILDFVLIAIIII